MSLRAILWALQDAPVSDPTQALILCAMAETAHDNGTEARASQATYARYARCSDRTLRRHLKEMEAAGVITRGDQGLVAHIRADRRPVVWDLNMSLTAGQSVRPDNLTPREEGSRPDTNVRPMPSRPDKRGNHGRTLVSDKPKTEPSLKNEPSTLFPEPPSNAPASTPSASDENFEAFWMAYPKKVAKPDARKAWRAALKRKADPGHIVRFAAEQALIWSQHKRDPQYIPYPATWLNRERYLDDLETPSTAPASGYRAYQNPTDLNVYDEDF